MGRRQACLRLLRKVGGKEKPGYLISISTGTGLAINLKNKIPMAIKLEWGEGSG